MEEKLLKEFAVEKEILKKLLIGSRMIEVSYGEMFSLLFEQSFYNGKHEKQISLLQRKKNVRTCLAVSFVHQYPHNYRRMLGIKITARKSWIIHGGRAVGESETDPRPGRFSWE